MGAVRHVLDLQLCASNCAIAGRRTGGFPLSLGQEIKTQSLVGLQNFQPPRASRTETLSKGETSKTDVPSANVAKFGPGCN